MAFRMDIRLGRGGGKCGVRAGDDGWFVYPPKRVTVVRDRCSAGGVGGEEVRSGSSASSGWGSAGSLRVSGVRDEVVEPFVVPLLGKALRWRDTMYFR